ncbi:MAG: ScyD/ScyE family protein [Actinomycetota bacterium]
MHSTRKLLLSALAATTMLASSVATAAPAGASPTAVNLVSGLQGGGGSTVGPDGALYVTEGAAGRISRVDPETGTVTTYASGLPKSIIGIGGAIDVAFIGNTAYVLVTVVGADVGGSNVDGIYRVDSADHFTVIADIGAFATANPPSTAFFLPTGVQYAMQKYRDGFLVTDGHHNRVYRVTLDGQVSVLIAFDNIVPTGIATRGNRIYLAQAGPVPHLPQNGKVVVFTPGDATAADVAAGSRLLVDVEFGPGRGLFALAQGDFPADGAPGSPAIAGTGSLVKVNRGEGTFTRVVNHLNRPTSLEFIGDTAYVVTLGGEIWKIENAA